MWCPSCQQEVPAVPHRMRGRIACARCQQELPSADQAYATQISDAGIPLDGPTAAVAASRPPLRRDDWQTTQHVRQLSRQLGKRTYSTRSQIDFASSPRRFDPPANLFDDFVHTTTYTETLPTRLPPTPISVSRRSESSQLFAWLVVVCGLLTLTAGISTIAWSLVTEQMMYWNLALGLTLGGQGALILGLVLVVTRLWRNSRFASGKLLEVHTRLAQLQTTADTLATMRSGGSAPAFYADLVRGASPQVMLANLKGQLDQLATHVAGNR